MNWNKNHCLHYPTSCFDNTISTSFSVRLYTKILVQTWKWRIADFFFKLGSMTTLEVKILKHFYLRLLIYPATIFLLCHELFFCLLWSDQWQINGHSPKNSAAVSSSALKKSTNQKKPQKTNLWEIFHIVISKNIELNRFSSTGSKGLSPPYMKFSQTGKIVFNTNMRPICFSNEHIKMHW